MSTIHGTVSKNGYSFYAEVTETVPSDYISTNSTTVNVSVYIQNHGTRTASGGWTFVLKVDGSEKIHLTSQTVKTNDVPSNGGTKLLMKTSVPVTHNSDGSKTATIEAYIEKPSYTAYDPGRCSLNGALELTKIPRYASVTFYAGSIQETSLRIAWAANATIQDVQYRLNNGSWITAQTDVNNLNGEFMINNLSPNTQYTIDVDVKRKDSGLWSFDTGYSMSKTITTHDYPKITSAPDFTIGNTLRIDFYNPLSRNCSIYIIFADGTEYGGDETTQNYVQGYTSNTWQNKFYSSIPNSRTGKYKVRLICTAVSRDTTVNGGTYTAPEAKPTFSNFSYYDADDQVVTVTGSNQTIVRNKSDVKIKISSNNKMVPKNYANPDRYEISWSGGTKSVPYSSSDIDIDLGKITTSGQTNISVTAYDKRGYWTTVSKMITVVNYTEPEQSNALYRINGFENDTKLTIKGTFNLLTINNINKNTITNVKYRYKEKSGTYNDYSTVQATVTDNKYECEMLSFNLDNSKSFVFEIVVTDKLGTYSKEIPLSEGIPILFINSTKKNIGIGEVNEYEEYSLQIKGNYYFKSGNEILDYDIVDETNHKVQLKNSDGQSVYPATLVDNLQQIDDICHERRVYDVTTGNAGWFEIFRLPSSSGWNGITLSFQLIGYNYNSYTRAYGQYYNAGTPSFTYIEAKGNVKLYFSKNSDNTVSVYCYIGDDYAPKILKILSYYNSYKDYKNNIFDGGYPKKVSEPVSKTEFSSW